MLRSAKPNTFSSEFYRLFRISRIIRIGSHLELPRIISPLHYSGKITEQFRLNGLGDSGHQRGELLLRRRRYHRRQGDADGQQPGPRHLRHRQRDQAGVPDLAALAEQPEHTGVVVTSPRGSALATVVSGGLRLVRRDREIFGVRGRSAEQRIGIDHLVNPEIGIVSLGGRAGTGKSALALAAGLDAVVDRQEHERVLVFRSLYAEIGRAHV